MMALLLGHEPAARRIRERIGHPGETLHAPHLLDLEVLQTLRGLVLGGEVSPERAQRARTRLSGAYVVRYPHVPLLERIWEIRHNLTAYDAAYVALAESLDAPLITLDARLSQAPGIRAEVEVHG